jgi:hypothetical protein
MAESMKNWTLVKVKQVINAFNDTDSISKHIVRSLEIQYKNSWYCIIGSTGNDDKVTKNLAKSAFLFFKMESLLFYRYKKK